MSNKISYDPIINNSLLIPEIPEEIKNTQRIISEIKTPFQAIEEQNKHLIEFINQITAPFKELTAQLPIPLTDKINRIVSYVENLQLENFQNSEDLNEKINDLIIQSNSANQLLQKDTFKNLPKYKQNDYLLKWLGYLSPLFVAFLTCFSNSKNTELNTKTINIQEQNNTAVNSIEQCNHDEILNLFNEVKAELEELKKQEILATDTTEESTETTLTSD